MINMKNFGHINNSFGEFFSNGIIENELGAKGLFKTYINEVKNNKVLSSQFMLYKSIEDKKCGNISEAYAYIDEIFKGVESLKPSLISEANTNLLKKFPLVKISEGKNELFEHISTILITNKTIKNSASIFESKKFIAEFLISNNKVAKLSEGTIPNSMLYSLCAESFNKKYDDLSDLEKEGLSLVINTKISDREELFNNTLNECISMVNSELTTTDLSIKESLLNVKSNLLDRKYDESTFNKDITKLITLKGNLKK